MLWQRVLTALVLAPLIGWAALVLPTGSFALAAAGLVMLGAAEWARLAGLASPAPRLGYAALVGIGLGGLAAWLDRYPWPLAILALASLWWCGVAVGVWRRRHERPVRGFGSGVGPRLFAGVVVLVPPWVAVLYLHGQGEAGRRLLLFLFALVWIADIAAYFAGRRWGRDKLALGLSPGKTWQGVYGALAGAAVSAIAWAVVGGYGFAPALGFTALCLLTIALSVVGDLFESWMKRAQGIKDSGALLPGHGGLLDRIDSFTAAAPCFVVGMVAMQLIP
jgi:phosphatidate cytidylyltransferase